MRRTFAVLLAAAFGLPLVLSAQSSSQSSQPSQGDAAIIKRLDTLEAQQRAIQKQLEEIKALLQRTPPAPQPGAAPAAVNVQGMELSLADTAVRGAATAKYVMVEFSDFQCPFCGRYSRDAYQQVQREFVDGGKLRYAFKHLPLESIHPAALKAAMASECARQQNKFWELHDVLFANQQALADVAAHAKTAGLDATKLQACLADPKTTARVKADQDEAGRLGASSTPSFFIGEAQAGGKVKLLRKMSGAQPYATFKAALQGVLATP